MKICFVTHDGVPLAKGGPYIKVKETKKYLESEGHEVSLYNMWAMNDKINEFDIIHIVSANLGVYSFARNLFYRDIKFLVEPVFYSGHSSSFINTMLNFDKMIRSVIKGVWSDYGFINDICEWAEYVLPNTESEANKIEIGFSIPGEKIKVIHNGVSKKFLEGDPELFKKKYGLENFILNVGHLGPARKNMLSLIKALGQIDHPSVIIGKVLDTEEAHKIELELKKSKQILLIDELENDSPVLASAYAACDTFVLPSLFETPGIAALEAALAGAKVVITSYGGTKDYFKDFVTYVNSKSVASIKRGIEAALNIPKSSRMFFVLFPL